MVENVLYFWYVFSHDPKFLFRIIEAVCLDVLDLIHSVLLLLPPLELLVKEVKDHKVQTPQIISSRQILTDVKEWKLRCYCER